MRGSLLVIVIVIVIAVAVAVGACAAPRRGFDAARLRTGVFRYRVVLADHRDAGSATITVERTAADRYRFANVVEGAFRQTWACTTTSGLAPIAVELGLGPDDDHRRTMKLAYRATSVTGVATRDGRTEAVRATLPADIVDQRVDWAALMSSPLATSFELSVYDPWTGISPVSARVSGPETVEVPAGRFDVVRVTYTIAKRGRAPETFVLWVTTAMPRLLIREDFPNGARDELVTRTP